MGEPPSQRPAWPTHLFATALLPSTAGGYAGRCGIAAAACCAVAFAAARRCRPSTASAARQPSHSRAAAAAAWPSASDGRTPSSAGLSAAAAARDGSFSDARARATRLGATSALGAIFWARVRRRPGGAPPELQQYRGMVRKLAEVLEEVQEPRRPRASSPLQAFYATVTEARRTLAAEVAPGGARERGQRRGEPGRPASRWR